jgi:hypothetical protein
MLEKNFLYLKESIVGINLDVWVQMSLTVRGFNTDECEKQSISALKRKATFSLDPEQTNG